MPFFAWRALRSREDKQQYLSEALAEVGCQLFSPVAASVSSDPQVAKESDVNADVDQSEASGSHQAASDNGCTEQSQIADSGFAQLSRKDRLALILPGKSGLSRSQMLLKKAVVRNL